MQRTMTRQFSILGRLGLWGLTLGTLASPLACAADVQLGTRGDAGEGSGAGKSNGSGGSPTNGGSGGNGSGATSSDGGTSLGGTSPGSGGTELGGTGGSGGIPADSCSTQLPATAKHDYSFSSSLAFDVTKVKPGTNLTYDWSGLTTDLKGNPVDLESITFIEIALWAMTPEEFANNWTKNAGASWRLDAASQLVMRAAWMPEGETNGTLRDLLLDLGDDPILSYFDPVAFPPENHVYTIAADTSSGAGTRMLAAFILDEDSDETEVHVDASSAQLTYSVDLRSLVPHSVPFGVPGLTIDGTHLARTGYAEPFDAHLVQRVEVASYALTLGDLESSAFMRRDTMADGHWSGPAFDQDTFDLSALVDADGFPFPGIDATHTWLVSLGCENCDAIAPMYLSVLHTCSPDSCGDGIVQTDLGELCDDGVNADEYGGCGHDCQSGPRCGDGVVQGEYGEECDSGPVFDPTCGVNCQVRTR